MKKLSNKQYVPILLLLCVFLMLCGCRKDKTAVPAAPAAQGVENSEASAAKHDETSPEAELAEEEEIITTIKKLDEIEKDARENSNPDSGLNVNSEGELELPVVPIEQN